VRLAHMSDAKDCVPFFRGASIDQRPASLDKMTSGSSEALHIAEIGGMPNGPLELPKDGHVQKGVPARSSNMQPRISTPRTGPLGEQ
jgi:hypothetical protein